MWLNASYNLNTLSKLIKHSKTYFILGLAIGLAIGLFFSLYNSNKETISELSYVIFNNKDSINDNNKTKEIKKKKKKKYKKPKKTIIKEKPSTIDTTILILDSLASDTLSDSTLVEQIDSLQIDSIDYNQIIKDSLVSNELVEDTQLEQNIEMVIAEDELIYSEFIIPQGDRNDFLCKAFGEIDSILTNNTITHKQEGIYVEFWQSPLNSTGYKLSNNTLVLYGFYQYEKLNLKYLKNGQLLISYLNNKFKVNCSDEFVSLQISK